MTSIPRTISAFLNKPARWATPAIPFDGHNRTVEVFGVPVSEQRNALRALRPERAALEKRIGGALLIVFLNGPIPAILSDYFKRRHPDAEDNAPWQMQSLCGKCLGQTGVLRLARPVDQKRWDGGDLSGNGPWTQCLCGVWNSVI